MQRARSGVRPRVRSRRHLIAIEQRAWTRSKWALILGAILLLMLLAYAAGRHDASLVRPRADQH